MALSVFVSKSQHRFDSVGKPSLSFVDYTSNTKLLIRDYLYINVEKPTYVWSPPNRTEYGLGIFAREMINPLWTISSGIVNNILNFTKTGADGFSGASAAPVSAGNCSIEGSPSNQFTSTVLSLQSGAVSYDYVTNADVEHALIFDQGGSGVIREKGAIKMRFSWMPGETGLVEHKNGIVRYYKIAANGEMILLRSKRSLLTYPISPALIIYHTGGVLNNVRIWNGLEATSSIDLFGVLSDFQEWKNQGTFESLAQKTTNKDKSGDFTYFSLEKNILKIPLSVEWDEGDNYRKFLEFYKFHDLSREFIFKDAARGREFFANFTTAFTDTPLGADTFGMAVEIMQMIDPPPMPQL